MQHLDSLGRRNNRKLSDRPCSKCGIVFRPARSSAAYCSVKCARSKNGGHNKKPESWWRTSKGYIAGRTWLPDGTRHYIKQHRYFMERHLGRKLLPNEDVHHINGVKDDNRIENLQVIIHGEHSRHHNLNGRIYRKGNKMTLTDKQRKERSDRAKACNLSEQGRAAIAAARGTGGTR